VYTLRRTGKSAEASGLAHAEAAIANKLFADGNTIEFKQANHASVAASISALKTSLASEYERVYFVTNSHWFAGGFAMLMVSALATAMLCDDPKAAGFILAWLAGWSIGTAALIHRAWDSWSDVFSGPGSRILNTLGALF